MSVIVDLLHLLVNYYTSDAKPEILSVVVVVLIILLIQELVFEKMATTN